MGCDNAATGRTIQGDLLTIYYITRVIIYIYVYGYSETGIELQLVLFRISVVNAGNSLAVDLPCPINISSTSFFLMISYVDFYGEMGEDRSSRTCGPEMLSDSIGYPLVN